MPTERFRFQSNYFKNFEMSGSVGYSSSHYTLYDLSETLDGWTSRSAARGTTAGAAQRKRVSVNADWSGTYAITDKLRILDSFRYDNWRIPGVWDSVLGSSLHDWRNRAWCSDRVLRGCQLQRRVTATMGRTAPAHVDLRGRPGQRRESPHFLGQNLKSNTFQIEYDFTSSSAPASATCTRIAKLCNAATSFTTREIYFPGAHRERRKSIFLAARGDCAHAGTPPALPAGCVLNANGSVTFTAPPPSGAPSFDSLGINENALLLGIVARPTDTLCITGDFAIGYNDHSYTRVSPRQMQTYRISVNYTPKPWAIRAETSISARTATTSTP